MPLDIVMLIATLFGVIAAVMVFQFSLDDDMSFRSGVHSHHTHEKAVTNALRVFAVIVAGTDAFGYVFRNLL